MTVLNAATIVADIAFLFIALSNFSKARTKPSLVNEAILQIRFIPQKEGMAIEIRTWFTQTLSHYATKLGIRY